MRAYLVYSRLHARKWALYTAASSRARNINALSKIITHRSLPVRRVRRKGREGEREKEEVYEGARGVINFLALETSFLYDSVFRSFIFIV